MNIPDSLPQKKPKLLTPGAEVSRPKLNFAAPSEQKSPFTFPSESPNTQNEIGSSPPSTPSQRIPLKAQPNIPAEHYSNATIQPFQPAPTTSVIPQSTEAQLRAASLQPPSALHPATTSQPIQPAVPATTPLSHPMNGKVTEAVQAAKPMAPFQPSSEDDSSKQHKDSEDLEKNSQQNQLEENTSPDTAVSDSAVSSTPFDPEHFLPQEMIRKQRDGEEISGEEISMFTQGVANGSVSEGQCAAYAMAVYLCGMTGGELVSLTKCLRDSGDVLSWDLEGPILDLHSTGGVGDIVPILLAPMLASCGGYVPMITGRSLGHTGGTLDKLDSIPGYKSTPDIKLFQQVVKERRCAIIGQTGTLAPADKRLYEIRDITATIESTPLITASMLAPKLAAGIQSLVVDIKAGNGAFVPDIISAHKLAQKIANVARTCGLKFSSVVTDMNQPLAHSAGNALEIKEAVRFLHTRRGRNQRLYEVVMALGEELLVNSGISTNTEEAREKLDYSLDSGGAAEHLGKMIRALGGPADFVERPNNYLKESSIIKPIFLDRSGVIHRVNTKDIGLAIASIGAGRSKVEDTIDYSVGLTEIRGTSESVDSRTPAAILHASSEDDWDHAAEIIRGAYELGPNSIGSTQPVIERIKPTKQ